MTTPAPASPTAGALLADLFDDAGLFPPASLPMDEAFAAHRMARQGSFRWMLARFVCPASRLGELADVASRFGDGLRLALIVDDEDAIRDAAAVVDDHGWRVETVEGRLDDADVDTTAQALRATADAVGAHGAFLEVPWREFPLDDLRGAARMARAANVGIKLRCGGETADAFPSPALVAAFLLACRDAHAPLKLTAGLHHPFRHPDPETGAVMHGFMNIVVGAVFAHSERASEPELAEVLSDEDDGALVLDGTRLAWHDHVASVEQIAAARRELLTAIGSCSFREPVDDLVAFGLLPQQ